MNHFHKELYIQHMEEAAFLYEQRRGLLFDPELSWTDLHDFEQRFEPHIDALVVGGSTALDTVCEQMGNGDPGNLHTAARLFLRTGNFDKAITLFKTADPEDIDAAVAVGDALCHELTETNYQDLIKLLSDDDPLAVSLAAEVIGYRRIDCKPQLLDALFQKNENSLPLLCWACGRLKLQEAAPLLLDMLHRPEEKISSKAALSLLRIGEPSAVDECLKNMETHRSCIIPAGLGGTGGSVSKILPLVSDPNMGNDAVISLGFLGNVSAVDPLIEALENELLSESAPLSLYLLTGAKLYEHIFVPDENDEGEEEESVSGITITRLTRDAERWRSWWNENKKRFDSLNCYRTGRPASPGRTLANMTSERIPFMIRQFAYEEMVIRYQIDFPFEADMTVAAQALALNHFHRYLQTDESRFEPGKWYFAGNPW